MINKFRGRYAFLSNFFPCRIILNGIFFPSAEHAYQASKTTDRNKQFSIAALRSPIEAKRAGKIIELRSDWDSVKLSVMEEILYIKFKSPCIKKLLLDTKDEELVEGNTWGDTFWGVDLRTNVGENNLGKILMRVREFYKGEG